MSVRVKAVSNIKHDEVNYEANDIFEVSDSEAEALVEAGAARYADEGANKKGGTPADSKRLDKNDKEAARVKAENDAKKAEADKDVPSIDWSRAQLDEHARTLGIEPADMPNKQAVLDAIEKNEA